MYDAHPEMKAISVGREQVISLIKSINSPIVAAAGKQPEPAKAYIIGCANPSGMFTIFIYLHLVQSKECVIYLPEQTEVARDSFHATELEALQFVESMGFMVDNLNYHAMSPEQRSSLLKSLPVFHQDLEKFARQHEMEESGVSAVEMGSMDESILELDDVAEVAAEVVDNQEKVVSQEGLVKLARFLSSF